MDLVPAQNVPVAPIIALDEVGTVHLILNDGRMRCKWHTAGIVASQLENLRNIIANLAPELLVHSVPSVVPFGLPVIVNAKLQLVVPVNLQVEVDQGNIHVHLLGIVEEKGRLRAAGQKAY